MNLNNSLMYMGKYTNDQASHFSILCDSKSTIYTQENTEPTIDINRIIYCILLVAFASDFFKCKMLH